MTNTLHAHVSTYSVDCDGPIERSYVAQFNDAEVAESQQEVNDFSEINFMNRVMCNIAGPYAAHQMTVKVDDDGIDVHEQTEEGYRKAEARWCREDCEDESSYRDIRAEAAGY